MFILSRTHSGDMAIDEVVVDEKQDFYYSFGSVVVGIDILGYRNFQNAV